VEGTGEGYSPLRDRFIEENLVEIIQTASALISDMIYDRNVLNRDGKFVTTPEYLSGRGLSRS